MGIVVRQSIKSVAVTLGGALLGALIAVLSTRFFPQDQFGFRETLIKASTWVTYLANFGFGAALVINAQKYPPGHPSRPTFLTLTALIPFAISLLTCAAFFILYPFIDDFYSPADAAYVKEFFPLFPILTLLCSGILWMEGYLQSLHKTALQSFGREILARIIYITLILLFGFHVINFSGFLWLYVIFYLVPFLFLIIMAKRSGGFAFGYEKHLFSVKEIKEIIRFAGYHMLTEASTVLIATVDVFIMGMLLGFDKVAIYGIATLAVSLLRNPTRMIGKAAIPTFTKSYNNGDLKGLRELYQRSSLNMQIIAVAMFALVYINIDNIQEIMALIKGGYNEIKPLIMILMVGQLFDMVSGFNYELIGLTKYYRFNFWIAIWLLAFVLLLDYFMIKSNGLLGAAWAVTIGLIAFNIAKSWFLWKKMKLQPFAIATLKIFAIGAVAGIISWILPYMFNAFIDGIIRSSVFGLLFWYLLFITKVSSEVNEITHNIIHKRRLY
ncbi:oligosaccharide flippase family protein [Taibaiella lutea]|uniref:Oligosaccharide flippase family protein n=1 Tax=Taibaiella lutea TaxID=2608001 RepID=A0A5M6CDQ1_9BACT|nr:oligosaccharide flippase family protein [Taibaiella lutea]KAA5533256.1 oligosaccharide flippase family protein [Taibaiella lutea]